MKVEVEFFPATMSKSNVVKQYKAKVNSPDHKYTTGVLLHNTIRGGNE